MFILFRSLWKKESEFTTEIDRLKADVVKAEKSLDHATPGVSIWLFYFYHPLTLAFDHCERALLTLVYKNVIEVYAEPLRNHIPHSVSG